YALLKHGVNTLTIIDPDASKATTLAGQLRNIFPQSEVKTGTPEQLDKVMAQATGLVNATPIGMHMHPGLPLDERYVTENLWVSDVVYRPLRTELIELAESRGCQVLHGGFMNVGQAIDGFEVITGVKVDGDKML